MDNRIFAYIGLAVGVVGLVLMIDFEERVIWHPVWFLGYALVTVSMPLGRTSTVSMLSKIIGPTRAGGYMGWYLCIGSIARCVGPFWAVKALSVSIRLCFGSTAAFLIACGILLWATWRNCEPHPEFIRQAANEQQAKKNS
jgi:MFS family permease